MTITSSAFEPSGAIPAQYTCDGADRIPSLAFRDVPADAKSLVLIMDDPDVPASVRPEQMWDHWVCWNIPPETSGVTEDEEPPGVIGKNTGGKPGYMGPCPPDREHRYFFKLYALDTTLDLDPAAATKTDVEHAMRGRVLAEATLMGRYNRTQNR